jgi:ankyrin repeat protein
MGQGKLDKDSALQLAFFHAARHGDREVVELLLKAGADIHFQSDIALRGAAEFGQTEWSPVSSRTYMHEATSAELAKKNRHKTLRHSLNSFGWADGQANFPSAFLYQIYFGVHEMICTALHAQNTIRAPVDHVKPQ